MAQSTNPKIEELRTRIRSDPKSRLFFPLAEELRKMGGLDEAEQALRAGLEQHPTYLSAWVSLGRVLRERGNNEGVIEVLSKALQLDPGNVVAARILADTYLEMGQKVEAIKKYKLVHALLPQDQDVEALVEKLDLELNPPALVPAPATASHPSSPQPLQQNEPPAFASPAVDPGSEAFRGEAWPADTAPEAFSHEAAAPVVGVEQHAESDRDDAAHDFRFQGQQHTAAVEEPRHPHSSQFDETAPLRYDSNAFAIEHPAGMHITGPESDDATIIGTAADDDSPGQSTPLSASIDEPLRSWSETSVSQHENAESLHHSAADPAEAATGDPFPSAVEHFPSAAVASGDEHPPAAPAFVGHSPDDVTNTITMGDLYARQGLVDDAREIYSRVLERDPGNESIRSKLDHLPQPPAPAPSENESAARAARLQDWLSKVKRGSRGV